MPKHANCDQVLCGCGGLSGEPSLAVRQALTQALPERALRRQPLTRGPSDTYQASVGIVPIARSQALDDLTPNTP